MKAIMIRLSLNKTSFFISIILTCFFAVTAFADIKVSVNQSIIYADGSKASNYSVVDLKKVLNSGGKVFIRFDFQVKEKGFFDSGDISIFLKFPDEYTSFMDEDFFKVTSLHGAKDASAYLLRQYKKNSRYSAIQNSFGRLPKVKTWIVEAEYERNEKKIEEHVETFTGIALRMSAETGNTASIEFYYDYAKIQEFYSYVKERDKKFAEWIKNNMLYETFIGVVFRNPGYTNYAIPTDEYVAKFGYNTFWIIYNHYYPEHDEISNSNHSYTIMIK